MVCCWSTLLILSCWIPLSFCDHDIVTSVGYAAFSRPISDTFSGVSLLPDKSTVIETSGKVVEFKYYSTIADRKLRFQIWRSPDNGNSWILLHQTQEVTTEGDDHYGYTCTEDEEFFVMPGDVIGVAIIGASPLTYTVVDCVDISPPMTSSGEFEEGDSTTFSSASSECRQYSLIAEVLYDTADVVSLECTELIAEDGFQNVSSPGYDGVTFYGLNIHACWKITVDPNHEDRDKFSIQIEMLDFNFEDPYISGDCNGDFVEIRNGATVFGWMAEELCGTSAPDQINGTKQDMYLRMVTNDNELTLGTGFNLQYRIYELDPSKGVNVLLIVGVIIAVILVAAVVIVVIFWCRLKRQRDQEEKKKLKDNEVNGLPDSDDDLEKGYKSRRSRPKSSNKVSPQMLRREKSLYANPTSPTTKMVAHKDADLKGHIPKDERMPPPSQYQSPRKKKSKHWSDLGADVQLYS